ncbi:hypothetical protein [Patulibacter defluvii]|uniref:hypothetical protein n=1 Tax=Patulibacter defluvii TaxID=3095358 RepID=UPI002A7623FF|nr:hypothetical protein [Patulibacter sp. DM4]
MRTTVFTKTDVRVQFPIHGYDGEHVTPTLYDVTARIIDRASATVEVAPPTINADGDVETVIYTPDGGQVQVELLVTAPFRARHEVQYTSRP